MALKTVDARGLLCPMPLIQTKKALQELPSGGELEVLLDNEMARCNVEKFLSDHGVPCVASVEGAVIRLRVRMDGAFAIESRAVSPSVVGVSSGNKQGLRHVIALRSDKMGDGPEELGAILIQAFVNTISETSPLPSAVAMFNTGVKLARDDSPVLPSLKKLETAGVRILVCGTCINYFGIKDRLAVGTISNMFDILSALSQASHVVSP